MNKTFLVFCTAGMLAVMTPAWASKELAQKNGCMACHGQTNKIVGPGYNEVAAKYKGQKGADTKLFESVKKGSQGKWGAVPMPAQTAADADIKTLVKWILAGAK